MKATLEFNLPEDEHEFYCATSKTKRKEYMKKLNYGIEPYPKGENKKYELGTFIEPIIIDTNVAQNSH
jgi:hypothetical protein